MASLSIRIKLDSDGRIGPGKVDLLEGIAASGSISAAGRKMAMSYRRAWELVEELNTMFATPVVERQIGGRNGGGARLTALGRSIVERYRSIERDAEAMARGHLEALQSEASASEKNTRGENPSRGHPSRDNPREAGQQEPEISLALVAPRP